ncbi:UV radiation resistance-associated gene protein [Pseudozyma hubeiensis SY62]|uniref:UV radiation resistance-associated gene protein n=1 Tax=Pseudozyma hubeiensis (strain SY62) TaxID=1305764 RepID=R9P0M6_PSEHS|nr:UV radiation resistance-associated gene protein [Pseudozyma hubeiensis SY62]GAC94706.1 UV radiation resistance-associated gene protein [Pseudozyma hubeiensis SY62]
MPHVIQSRLACSRTNVMFGDTGAPIVEDPLSSTLRLSFQRSKERPASGKRDTLSPLELVKEQIRGTDIRVIPYLYLPATTPFATGRQTISIRLRVSRSSNNNSFASPILVVAKMKSLTIIAALAFTLIALLSKTSSSPLPQLVRPTVSTDPYSAVLLELDDGHAAQCTIPAHPTHPSRSRTKADMVSSYLVASGKMACQGAREHADGVGKTLLCVKGQLSSNDDAISTLKGACDVHQGLHSSI